MNEKELKISAENARIAYKNADVKGTALSFKLETN